MKTIIKSIVGLAVLASLLFSCKNNLSLQQFIVEQQEKQDILSFELSSSLLTATQDLQSDADLETLKSVKKITVLAYQLKDTESEKYVDEVQHVNKILKQDKYAELLSYGKGEQAAKVYLLDTGNIIDEFIVFANDSELGWLLVRILGDNMKPEKIIPLLQKIDFDKGDFNLLKLKEILHKKYE